MCHVVQILFYFQPTDRSESERGESEEAQWEDLRGRPPLQRQVAVGARRQGARLSVGQHLGEQYTVRIILGGFHLVRSLGGGCYQKRT